jgi:hypothetical protein
MIVCDFDIYDVCRCLDEDDGDDPYSCECALASGFPLRCDRCSSKMIVIDADSGQRLVS